MNEEELLTITLRKSIARFTAGARLYDVSEMLKGGEHLPELVYKNEPSKQCWEALEDVLHLLSNTDGPALKDVLYRLGWTRTPARVVPPTPEP